MASSNNTNTNAYMLHIASDVLQEKVNLEIPFPNGKPGIDALRVACEDIFTEEMRMMFVNTKQHDPRIAGIFSIGRMQIYDDDAMQWVDLVSTAQIHPYDQLYAFPIDLSHICQARRELPPPRPAIHRLEGNNNTAGVGAANSRSASGAAISGSGTSPKFRGGAVVSVGADDNLRGTAGGGNGRGSMGLNDTYIIGGGSSNQQQNSSSALALTNSANQYGHHSHQQQPHAQQQLSPLPPHEALQLVYRQLDGNNDGFITAAGLSNTLNKFGILFSATVVNEMFGGVIADNNDPQNARNGVGAVSSSVWSFTDYQFWSRQYPVLFAALHQRVTIAMREEDLISSLRSREESANEASSRAEELRRLLSQAEAEASTARQTAQQLAEDIRHLRNKRAADEEEEQPVLDKEISVQYKRALLRREERDFAAMASRTGLLTVGASSSSAPAAAYNGNISSSDRLVGGSSNSGVLATAHHTMSVGGANGNGSGLMPSNNGSNVPVVRSRSGSINATAGSARSSAANPYLSGSAVGSGNPYLNNNNAGGGEPAYSVVSGVGGGIMGSGRSVSGGGVSNASYANTNTQQQQQQQQQQQRHYLAGGGNNTNASLMREYSPGSPETSRATAIAVNNARAAIGARY